MIKKLFKSSAVRYALSSASSWVVDNVIYYLLFTPLGSVKAQVIARVFSSVFNFNMNNFFVFKGGENYWKAFGKYYCVCIPQAMISVLLVKLVTDKLSVTAPLLATGIKIVIELVLFVISYFIQNKWVFGKKKEDSEE